MAPSGFLHASFPKEFENSLDYTFILIYLFKNIPFQEVLGAGAQGGQGCVPWSGDHRGGQEG